MHKFCCFDVKKSNVLSNDPGHSNDGMGEGHPWLPPFLLWKKNYDNLKEDVFCKKYLKAKGNKIVQKRTYFRICYYLFTI